MKHRIQYFVHEVCMHALSWKFAQGIGYLSRTAFDEASRLWAGTERSN